MSEVIVIVLPVCLWIVQSMAQTSNSFANVPGFCSDNI